MINAVINDSKIELPEGMIKSEIERQKDYYKNMLNNAGSKLSFEQYLNAMGKDEASFETELRENAIKNVKTELIIEAIAKKEDAPINKDDQIEELKRVFPDLKDDAEIDKKLKSINEEAFNNMIKQRKAVNLMIETAKVKKK